MRTYHLILLSFILLLPSAAKAGGSFGVADIQDLLAQNPVLQRFIADHLETTPGGMAERIGHNSPALTGKRVAPYQLKAKPKGAEGDYTLTLTIEAETHYLDDKGEEVPVEKATQVKERLTGIHLSPR